MRNKYGAQVEATLVIVVNGTTYSLGGTQSWKLTKYQIFLYWYFADIVLSVTCLVPIFVCKLSLIIKET